MLFFFVGGVNQQVRQVVQYGADRCVWCGSRADLVEYENVLKLFFIPVWNWPATDLAMFCNHCDLFYPTTDYQSSPPPPSVVSDDSRCRFCDQFVQPDFSFCPSCGSHLEL